jgi:hypothetical protein
MTKITRFFPIKEPICWNYDMVISEFIQELNRIKDLGATHINLSIDDNYGDALIEMEAQIQREETDEEYKIRIALEIAHWQKVKINIDEQLKKLQADGTKP